MYIQFFPTFRCNSACGFCFNRGLTAGPDIQVGAFGKMADILSGQGIDEIDLLGGEPTLHPGFPSLVEFAISKGFNVSMSTNGSKPRMLAETARRFDRDSLTIGISLNGHVGRRLLSFISNYNPVLKSVCKNDRFLPEIADKFLGKYINKYYAIFMDTLRPADLEESLSFPGYYRKLQLHREKHDNLEGVFCQGFLPGEDSSVLKGARCPAGTTKLSIMPDGTVYPCYLLFRNPDYRLGNIFSDSFKKILKNPILGFFRNFEKNNCANSHCEFSSHCHGGCPAVSLAICGNINAPDPRCTAPLFALV